MSVFLDFFWFYLNDMAVPQIGMSALHARIRAHFELFVPIQPGKRAVHMVQEVRFILILVLVVPFSIGEVIEFASDFVAKPFLERFVYTVRELVAEIVERQNAVFGLFVAVEFHFCFSFVFFTSGRKEGHPFGISMKEIPRFLSLQNENATETGL
jgi:hypothetical protein